MALQHSRGPGHCQWQGKGRWWGERELEWPMIGTGHQGVEKAGSGKMVSLRRGCFCKEELAWSGAGLGAGRGHCREPAWSQWGRYPLAGVRRGAFLTADLDSLSGTLGSPPGLSPETWESCAHELRCAPSTWPFQDGGFSSQSIAPGRGSQGAGTPLSCNQILSVSVIFQEAESQESSIFFFF